jgi:hypothetical protein
MAYAGVQRFTATGTEQAFTVPAGVTSVHIVAVGAKGGGALGGVGGTATADLAVTPGQTLYVEVGGIGQFGPAGFNGGGSGGGFPSGGSGGGASDVRTVARATAGSSTSRLLVAGGGGGAAYDDSGNGGFGGGTQGGNGSGGSGGAGGTQASGDANGIGGGGSGESSAGGGGGYRGGAGGGLASGGGGGSGYFGPGTSHGLFGTAGASEPPSVTISYTDPPSAPAAPDTTLVKHPKAKIKTDKDAIRVRFSFTASDPNATFRCKLDSGKEKACDPGVRYRVRRGFHQFTVVAVLNGVRDPSPADFSFTVKRKEKPHPNR